MENFRNTIVEILKKEYADLQLKKMQKLDIDIRDKRLITTIVYGVIEQKIYLDYMIRKFSSVRLKKINEDILNILRMSVYQIIFLDKIPHSAIVNEAVKLSKLYDKKRSGFVNGVLRNLIRNYKDIKMPTDPIKFLSIRYSTPLWLVNRWIEVYGFSFTEELLKANLEKPSLVFRTNTLFISRDDLIKQLAEIDIIGRKSSVPEGIIIDHIGTSIDNNDLFKKGYYTIQDESSMHIAHIVDPKETDYILDLCAAPGGKTTHMAERMKNKGQVYSCDISDEKIKYIKQNVKRLQLNNIRLFVNDGTILREDFIDKFDKVLVDAPCSGFGIIRRKPDIKYNKSIEIIEELTSIQYNLLMVAQQYVKENGYLIYSTCTIEPKENRKLIESFIKNNDFEIVEELSLFPHIDKTDGFYCCKLKKSK